ncbi:MAG: PAAR domain-containing protein [Lysobacter sp.]
MTKDWIVVGDVTSSGGRVVSGSPFTDIDGKQVAREGDMATCPLHKGTFPIAAGCDPTTIVDGKPVALHGAKLSCGCSVLAVQQRRVFIDAGGRDHGRTGAAGTSQAEPMTAAQAGANAVEAAFDQRFQLADSLTGVPLGKQPYRLSFQGEVTEAVTDVDGCTRPLPTGASAVDVECEILGMDEVIHA